MIKKRLPSDVLDFFKRTGAKGGRSTVKKYGRKQMAKWGKLGGRPKRTKGGAQRTSTKGQKQT